MGTGISRASIHFHFQRLTCTALYNESSQPNVALSEYPPEFGLERGPGGRLKPDRVSIVVVESSESCSAVPRVNDVKESIQTYAT